MYALKQIAEMTNCQLLGQSVLKNWLLATDSRTITNIERTLFFAIKTPFNNGEFFISELYEKGVRNFVVSLDFEHTQFKDANFLKHQNTVQVLQQLVVFHRKQFNIPIIGISGSNGKTIVKEWLKQLLINQFSVCANPKSYNSQIGVPLSVWQLNNQHQIGIFEAGISLPNEMEYLEKMIQPNIGIMTHLGTAHNEGFENQTHKIKEKLKLFKHVDVLLSSFVNKKEMAFEGRLLCYGFNEQSADLNIYQIEKSSVGSHVFAQYKNQNIDFKIPFIDQVSIENACLCALFTLYFNSFRPENFENLTPISMRLELKKGINNNILVNDSYSNDIDALSAALSFLKKQNIHQQSVVILSDIEQSGCSDSEICQQIYDLLIEKKIDYLIGIGTVLNNHESLFKKGKFKVELHNNTNDFLTYSSFKTIHNSGILIKGARQFRFENIVKQLELLSYGSVLEINLSAVLQNLQFFKTKLKKDTKIMAMVKAFAYGSGSYEIAKLLHTKVDYLAVAYADEGVNLRNNGIQTPIMVLNVDEESISKLSEYQLEPVVFSFNQLKTITTHFNLEELSIHLEIDTGMHRLGFMNHEINELIAVLKNHENIKVKSIFSHLSASDEAQYDEFTHQQFQSLDTIAKQIETALNTSVLKHISNTAGILRFDNQEFNMVRLGIGLYGIDPSAQQQNELQTVFSLKTTISQLKTIEANESVGYSRKAIENKTRTIAILAIGYADGLNRKLSNKKGGFYINQQFAPILGNVCMDMCMVDVSNINCKEGDEAELFGKQTDIESIAALCDTIPYEILTSISQRVKRVYVSE